MSKQLYEMKFEKLYPMYVDKAVRKGRTALEVDEVISWLTGYSASEIHNFSGSIEEFFTTMPAPSESRVLIKGSICGVKIQEIEDPLMKEIRYLDKLIDELAKGKAMEKILRK